MAEVDLFVKSVVLFLFLPFCFIIVIYILTDGNLEDYKWLTSYEEIRKRYPTSKSNSGEISTEPILSNLIKSLHHVLVEFYERLHHGSEGIG